ncbi:anti-sigma factor [Zoogloea sp.]|uniref:anti-sigma factor family protein n=1 Tax=Zoogloea sp. TaxID=49181 RepID=UPI001416CDFB|nr:MAG: anti-sigma factor [Zoogloea sp.]
MNASTVSVTDTELNAFLDGELAPARRAEVELWLAAHPDAVMRLEHYLAQREALQRLFNPVLDEALPEGLQQAAQAPVRPGWWHRWPWQQVAAGLLLACVGAAGGWFARDHQAVAPLAVATVPLSRQAAVAHAVFSPDVKRPVEISAEHEDQLVTWLSKRLGTAVRPPHLEPLGFELIGGRLLPGSSGPVAQFMYHDASGQRLTLYVSTENASNRDTAFRFAQEGGVNVFYWIDGRFGYALSAGIPKDALARVATAVYDQLERR